MSFEDSPTIKRRDCPAVPSTDAGRVPETIPFASKLFPRNTTSVPLNSASYPLSYPVVNHVMDQGVYFSAATENVFESTLNSKSSVLSLLLSFVVICVFLFPGNTVRFLSKLST